MSLELCLAYHLPYCVCAVLLLKWEAALCQKTSLLLLYIEIYAEG